MARVLYHKTPPTNPKRPLPGGSVLDALFENFNTFNVSICTFPAGLRLEKEVVPVGADIWLSSQFPDQDSG